MQSMRKAPGDTIRSHLSTDPSYTPARQRPLIRRAIVVIVGAAMILATLTVPANAHVHTNLGHNCAGDEVRKCLWINVDHHNTRLRGSATVTDVFGDTNHYVAVNNIVIRKKSGNGTITTITASAYHDEDGWHDDIDRAATGLVECSSVSAEFQVQARMVWHSFGDPTGSTYRSNWVEDEWCDHA